MLLVSRNPIDGQRLAGPGGCFGKGGVTSFAAALCLRENLHIHGPALVHDLDSFRCCVRGVLQDQCGHNRDELSKSVGVLQGHLPGARNGQGRGMKADISKDPKKLR